MRNALVWLALLTLLGTSACNTAEGVGKDLQSLGEALEEEAGDF